jgi:alpha-N-acetylglucosamine transferase
MLIYIYNCMNIAFVTLSDQRYSSRALKTIKDLRSNGQWKGDIIWITVDFIPDNIRVKEHGVTIFHVKHLNTDNLIQQLKRFPPSRKTNDNRQFVKLTQWDKIHVFDHYFKRYSRIVYLDAGLCVFNNVNDIVNLPFSKPFIAPIDGIFAPNQFFQTQVDLASNPSVAKELLDEFTRRILDQKYFLNCMWMYDTTILDTITMDELVQYMNKYPIALTNEMTIMNLIIHFKYDLWEPLPEMLGNKNIFGWCNSNYKNKTRNDFYFIKYPTQ